MKCLAPIFVYKYVGTSSLFCCEKVSGDVI